MTRIAATTYRYKRPPRKRKSVALEAPAVVTPRKAAAQSGGTEETAAEVPHRPARQLRPKPAIVTTTSKKRWSCYARTKRAGDTDGDPEMRAWLLGAMQGRWPRDD